MKKTYNHLITRQWNLYMTLRDNSLEGLHDSAGTDCKRQEQNIERCHHIDIGGTTAFGILSQSIKKIIYLFI